MSEERPGLARIHAIWILLGGFLVTALGATAVGLIVAPERRDSGLNEWILVVILAVGAAGALGILNSRWFSRVPEDVAAGVTVGVLLRMAIAETVWLIALMFFLLGLVGFGALLVALGVAAALTLLFAAPTARLVASIQEQLDRKAPGTDIAAALRAPMPR